MDFGKAFKKIREECNLSRLEMATKLCCTATSLWKIENGKVTPKKSTIDKFCKVTSTPLAYFYTMTFTVEDFRINPNGLMVDGTPIYQDGLGRIWPV